MLCRHAHSRPTYRVQNGKRQRALIASRLSGVGFRSCFVTNALRDFETTTLAPADFPRNHALLRCPAEQRRLAKPQQSRKWATRRDASLSSPRPPGVVMLSIEFKPTRFSSSRRFDTDRPSSVRDRIRDDGKTVQFFEFGSLGDREAEQNTVPAFVDNVASRAIRVDHGSTP
jgi:hypothetical protein